MHGQQYEAQIENAYTIFKSKVQTEVHKITEQSTSVLSPSAQPAKVDLAAIGQMFDEITLRPRPVVPIIKFESNAEAVPDDNPSPELLSSLEVPMCSHRAMPTRKSNDSGYGSLVSPRTQPRCLPEQYLQALDAASPDSLQSEGEKSFVGNADEECEEPTMSLSRQEIRCAHRVAHLSILLYKFLSAKGRLSELCGTTERVVNQSRSTSGQSQASNAGPNSRKRPRNSGTSPNASYRHPDGGGHREDEDEDEDERGKLPVVELQTLDVLESGKTFACPYHKADPITFSQNNSQHTEYRVCGAVLLRDIPQVKQHLYRVHIRPTFYCPNCFLSCKGREHRDAHVRLRECEVVSDPFAEKMSDSAYTEIKKKKREPIGLTGQARTDYRSRIWFEIFKTIFPNRQRPYSPYVNNQECVTHFFNLFRTMGPTAYSLYCILNQSTGGIPLPEVTRGLVQEAYIMFLANCCNPPTDNPQPEMYQTSSGTSSAPALATSNQSIPLPPQIAALPCGLENDVNIRSLLHGFQQNVASTIPSVDHRSSQDTEYSSHTSFSQNNNPSFVSPARMPEAHDVNISEPNTQHSHPEFSEHGEMNFNSNTSVHDFFDSIDYSQINVKGSAHNSFDMWSNF